MPLSPVPATIVLIVAGGVLAAALAWWNRKLEQDLPGALFTSPPPIESPAALLRADAAVLPFRGESRARLVDELLSWCTDDGGTFFRLVIGPGGVGKTRLAEHLALRLPRRWISGRLNATASTDMINKLSGVRRPVLLIVDYAESRGHQLEIIANATAKVEVKVRVLLLARSNGDWLPRLAARSSSLVGVLTCPIHRLGPAEPTTRGRAIAWSEALNSIAARLPTVHGYAGNWKAIAATLRSTPPADLDTDRFASMLGLQMSALAKLLAAGPGPDIPNSNGGNPEDVLLLHEERYWSITARAHHLQLSSTTLRGAVAASTILGAADLEEARAITSQLPGIVDLRDDEQQTVAEWLNTVYPGTGTWWGTVQPDLLAEHLAAKQLAAQPALLDRAVDRASAGQLEQAITVLTRAAVTHPLDEYIRRLVLAHPIVLVRPAIEVAIESERPGPLQAALSDIVDHAAAAGDLALLGMMDHAIPQQTQVHRELAANVNKAQARLYRSLDNADPAENMPKLAMSLNSLSGRLGALGRSKEGLAASEEAVAICRHLQVGNEVSADLAMSLNTLAGRLTELHRPEEGLAAIEEAVSIYRQLAQDRPTDFLPALASSLSNLSFDLGVLALRDEALAAIEEAVTIYRQLAQARPDAFLPELAMTLNNLSIALGELNRAKESLDAIEEAVTIYRQLAQAQPDAFRPDLVKSLNNQASRLVDLGRYDGLAEIHQEASQEASQIRR